MPKGTCSIEGCDKPAQARTWCKTHLKRWRTHGSPLVTAFNQPKPTCSVEGCEAEVEAKELCAKHYLRLRRHGDVSYVSRRATVTTDSDICSVEGCEKPRKGLGMCAMHYARFNGTGTVDLIPRTHKEPDQCSVDGCDQPVECRDLCNMHYLRLRSNGDPLVSQVSPITLFCTEPGCKRRDAKAGLCWTHYRSTVTHLKVEQQGRCKICGVHESEAPRGMLLLDHDHSTRKVRSLLCHNCNCGLGHFKDSEALLLEAIEYLRWAAKGVDVEAPPDVEPDPVSTLF